MENYESTLSELLEVESVDAKDELSSYETWDSLTVLSVIAFCDSEYDVQLTAEEITDSKTVEGLKNLILLKKK